MRELDDTELEQVQGGMEIAIPLFIAFLPTLIDLVRRLFTR